MCGIVGYVGPREATPVLVEHFQKLNLQNLTVVSPDAGGVERARAFAKRLNAELAIMNKRPPLESRRLPLRRKKCP